MNLPTQYAWLANEAGPRILLEALPFVGLHEVPGAGSNPTIMAWAKSVGASSYYPNDGIPWCALFMAYVVQQAGFKLPNDPLRALAWKAWGTPIPVADAKLGDILIMERAGGGHVTLYIAETATHYIGLGGNQSDAVSFVAFPKTRIKAVRRCPWKVSQPDSVRKIKFTVTGPVSVKED